MSEGDLYYETALNLTKEAGKLIRERIWKNKTIEEKSCEIDLVTETDKEVENVLIHNLSTKFPSHKFIGEESASEGKKTEFTDAPTWIIDPVDGTMNFVHGFPHCCISLALFINRTAEIGIIYNPTIDQLFTARKGKGAYLNGQKISTSGEKDLAKALLMFEVGTSKDDKKIESVKKNFLELTFSCHGTRSLGSCALNMAMVALGCADGYFEFGIHAWDVAAGELIVREAGGVVLDPAGGPLDILSRRMLCASTPEIAETLVDKIAQFYPEPRD